jgi:hypothetical protein
MGRQQLVATRIDPWHQPALQSRLALLRLSAAAAAAPATTSIATAAAPQNTQPRAAPDPAPAAEPPEIVSTEANECNPSSPVELDVVRIDAALAVLAAAPPGAEAVALQALDSALRPDGVAALLRRTERILRQFAVRPSFSGGCLLHVLIMPSTALGSPHIRGCQ